MGAAPPRSRPALDLGIVAPARTLGALSRVPGSRPDSLVAWARRQGGPAWLALGAAEGFELRRLPEGDAADTAVRELASAVRRPPSSWLWVHALAALTLAWLPGCAPEPVPPLPLEPNRWVAEAEGLTWRGPVQEGWSALLSATRAEGRWREAGMEGRFETLIVGLIPEGGDGPFATVTARRADGGWPRGPLVLRDATWEVDGRLEGAAPRITWGGGTAWSCGGCPLEALAEDVGRRGLGALRGAVVDPR